MFTFVISPSTDTDPPSNSIKTINNIAAGDAVATVNYSQDTGLANAITVAPPGLSTLFAGLTLTARIAQNNTGPTTLNAGGTGALPVVLQNGAPLSGQELQSNGQYLFQYTGSQFVYNSSVIGLDCGLIAPGAAVTVDGVAYWMGANNFYMFNGTVTPCPNVEDIRKYVFDAVPVNLAFQCCAVYVPKFHEIWFFYPTTGATNPTNYVIFHIPDQCWSIGTANFYSSAGVTAGRASGAHFTQGDTSPLMAGTDGFIYNHDPIADTNNDNGNPLSWSATLSTFSISEGVQNADVEGVRFDFFEQNGNITATINTYNELTDTAVMDTQTSVIPDVQAGLTDFRVAGRYLSLSMGSSDSANYMRLGRSIVYARPSATRR